MSHVPQVLAVCVNWNGGPVLSETLTALANSTYPALRVAVVDNASTDGSVDSVPTEVQVVRLVRNSGYSSAINEAVRRSTELCPGGLSYYLVMNNDLVVAPGAVADLVAFAERTGPGVFGPKVLRYDEPERLDRAWGNLTWSHVLTRFCGQGAADSTKWDRTRRVELLPGSILLIHRRVVDDVGLFDEKYFMYHEEVDYLYRAARKGYPVFFCPFAEARHHGAYSTRHQPLQRVYWVRRNTVYFLRKHRPGWWGWAYFWLTLALSLGFNLCRCRFERVKAILTGLTDGMGMRVAQPSPLQVSTGSAAVRTASETLAPRGLDQAGGKCGQAPDVSFVIPCFNSRSTIGTTIDSIMRQSSRLNLETIVVDSSDDDTVEVLRKDWPQVRVVHSPVRLFPGAARNRGAELAGGRLIAFVDADAAVQPGWLERLCSALEARPSVTMAGGAVGNANPRPLPSRVLHLVEFSEYLPGLAPGLRRALSSSNLLVRRDDFLSSRRFAEDYAMAEDLLLCQAWSGGILFESRACVLHRHRSTWTRARRHLYELGWWSGRYRGERASRDRWLSAAPGLSLLLPWIRTLLICSRLVRSGGPTAWGGLFLAPLIWGALLWWAVGLHRGLKDGLRRRRASAAA